MHRLVLGWLNCPEVPATAMAEVAAAAGFADVGVRITGRKPGDGLPDIAADRTALAAMRTRADDAGVRIHNVSAYHLYPEIALRDIAPVFDAADTLGARTLVIGCYDPDHARFAERLAGFADAAAARNVRLALEFVPFSACRTLAAALAIVGAVAKANVGLIVDPLHLARSGGTPEDVQRVPRAQLFFLQLCDAPAQAPPGLELPAEARGMRLAPGEGALPLRALFAGADPELDVECEFPGQGNLGLAPVDRARAMRAAAARFLANC